jgi:predicted MFS family arabinose efflux permease
VGLGLGFGYSSATPPALKWFPPSKTGLIAGLVVAGFGLAPVYLAPLSQWLLRNYQVKGSMLILGLAFVAIVCGLAQLLKNPPAGYVAGGRGATSVEGPAVGPGQMIREPIFWLLWVVYFIGAGAGLMVISSVSGMAKKSMGESAFVAVALMAVGNAGGRILAGILSDRIGRRWTLMLVLLFQAGLMFASVPVTAGGGSGAVAVVVLAVLIGANYGANLSLFPSLTKDFWGLKSFGINYGVLFTAWGVGGMVLPRLQQTLTAASGGSYASSFQTAGGLLLVGGFLSLFVRGVSPKK